MMYGFFCERCRESWRYEAKDVDGRANQLDHMSLTRYRSIAQDSSRKQTASMLCPSGLSTNAA
jgi:hypothetical protein